MKSHKNKSQKKMFHKAGNHQLKPTEDKMNSPYTIYSIHFIYELSCDWICSSTSSRRTRMNRTSNFM